MSKWIQRGSFTSIKDVILNNIGLTEEELINPPQNYYISGLKEAADVILNAIMSDIKITIYGDYDADGITSSALLYQLLTRLGAKNVTIQIPRRFSEGYGFSLSALSKIDEGLILMVDNGIAAVDAIKEAKALGLTTVILDHHLISKDGILPPADVIVDPNAISGSDFSSYCGAGLAFKLAQMMLSDEKFLDKLSSLAAIGTIADVMPLIKDNRNIVLRGLANINNGDSFVGLRVLLEQLSLYICDEEDIAFKIAPTINACSRMLDDGAMIAVRLLATESSEWAKRYATKLIELNQERKQVVAEGMTICEQIMSDQCLYGESPLIVHTTKTSPSHIHEGVAGILAGKLAERFKCPAFVLTETENGVLKGSGRSFGGINIKSLLDSVSDSLIAYGGHSGAAGLKVCLDNINAFKQSIQKKMSALPSDSSVNSDVIYYDLEIDESNVFAALSELKRYAPFGEGNTKPIFTIKNVHLIPKAGKFYRLMGDVGQHIKLFASDFDVVAFDMSENYRLLGEPLRINLIGNISENRFNGNVYPQITAMDMAKENAEKPKSSLADALADLMKNNGF